MNETVPFATRLGLAWRVLTDAVFAAQAARAERAPAVTIAPETPAPPPLLQAAPDAALQLLGLLQQEGRFIDFLQENVDSYSDAEIGGAARVVHQGCQKVLREHVALEPISSHDEGQRMTLEAGFDAARYRLTGNVVGQPPFTGALMHRGWRATEVKLPKVAPGHDVSIVAPAEVAL